MIGKGFSGRDSNRANIAFTLGLFSILAALTFQYVGGFQPCELCLGERIPYYVGLPIILIVIGGWRAIPAPPRIFLTLIAALIFVWSTYLGSYHAGVEWHLWAGPQSCTGLGEMGSFSDLNNLDAVRVVPCDQAPIRILGISMAGYNALVSAVIAFFLFWSALGQFQRCQLDQKKMREKAEAERNGNA